MNETELCPDCGAYWECEDKQIVRQVTDAWLGGKAMNYDFIIGSDGVLHTGPRVVNDGNTATLSFGVEGNSVKFIHSDSEQFEIAENATLDVPPREFP